MKDSNKILKGEDVGKMSSRKLTKLNIEYQEDQNEQSSDISWVAKLETNGLTSLTIKSQKRIQQETVKNVLKKKYKENLFDGIDD